LTNPISVIVRARNEALWLDRCLRALNNQSRTCEIILVDNESTDDTRSIAKRWNTEIVDINTADFTFGRALNVGIDEASHEVIAIISAHCVPVDELWADFIAIHLEEDNPNICGVYGRQEPLPETSDVDSRDLWTTFRNERLVQEVDYFFHNANSAIRKSLWLETPFDELINGVEDRAWAKTMITKGFQITYEPHARVYHHHGIHHGRNEGRARRVAHAIKYVRDL
jgi:glycosyltransferase involved in cell wall biosynthesis